MIDLKKKYKDLLTIYSTYFLLREQYSCKNFKLEPLRNSQQFIASRDLNYLGLENH